MSSEMQMDCQTLAGRSTEWLDGALGAREEREVASHLKSCESCRVFIGQVEKTAGLVGEWARKEGIQPAREDQILAAIGGSGEVAEPGSAGSAHLNEVTARAYLEDRLPEDEQIAVLAHLIDGCERCARECAQLAFPELVDRLGYRTNMRAPEPDEETATHYREITEQLLDEMASGREENVECHEALSEPYLLWLIRQGRELIYTDPQICEDYSRLAALASRRLGVEIRARAAMFRGHAARRVAQDNVEMERSFLEAKRLLERCQEPLLQAKLRRLRGLGLRVQDRPDEAIQLVREALQQYLELGEAVRAGEAALDLAIVEANLNRYGRAVRRTYAATCLLDFQDDPRLELVLFQHVAIYGRQNDRLEVSRHALDHARRSAHAVSAGRLDLVQIDWVEGQLLNRIGRFDDARLKLLQTRDALLALGLPGHVSNLGFDLAESLLELGRYRELEEVASAMLVYFNSRVCSESALASVQLFVNAVSRQALTVAELRAIAARVRSV